MRSCLGMERMERKEEMMNDEVDVVLARRVKECVADKHLPGDFADRLVRSVRRRRYALYTKIAAVVVLLVFGGVGFWGYLNNRMPQSAPEARLIAAKGPAQDTQVSGWMLLGFFRECFRRNKANKRKEDE